MGRQLGALGTPEERLKRKIKVDANNCWILQTRPNNNGYGSFWLYPSRVLAHRASWMIFKGDIPSGMCVCHRCDVRLCVNPDHLFIGSVSDNIKDAVAKGRSRHPGHSHKTHCKNGHEFNAENTYRSGNHRSCRACHRNRERARRAT